MLNNTTGQEALFICNEPLETARERTLKASTGDVHLEPRLGVGIACIRQ